MSSLKSDFELGGPPKSDFENAVGLPDTSGALYARPDALTPRHTDARAEHTQSMWHCDDIIWGSPGQFTFGTFSNFWISLQLLHHRYPRLGALLSDCNVDPRTAGTKGL